MVPTSLLFFSSSAFLLAPSSDSFVIRDVVKSKEALVPHGLLLTLGVPAGRGCGRGPQGRLWFLASAWQCVGRDFGCDLEEGQVDL